MTHKLSLTEEDEVAFEAAPPVDAPSTPMMAQYWQIKRAHHGYLLFYRMGDFYELFFDDAVTAAETLDIALTRRGKHQGADIPMCGVPVHAAESYLERLIRAGHKVAICEQTEDPALAKKRGAKSVVAREVIRLVTPGTLTEDQLLDPRRANVLAALARVQGVYSVAFVELTGGAMSVSECSGAALASVVARVAPSEFLVADGLAEDPAAAALVKDLGPRATLLPSSSFSVEGGERALKTLYGVSALDGFGSFTRAEIAAAGALAQYLDLTQKGRLPPLQPLRREEDQAYLLIDPATRRNLELVESLEGQRRGSLLDVIDHSVTAAGGRKLAQWLLAPLTRIPAIAARQDAVAFFKEDDRLRDAVRIALKRAPDMGRALTRLALGRGGPRDLGALRDGLAAGFALPEMRGLTDPPCEVVIALDHFAAPDGPLRALAARLDGLLEVELPLIARDGGFIRPQADDRLDAARALRDDSRRVIAALEARLKTETGIGSLKIRHNAVLGYFIETTQIHAEKLSPAAGYIHRQTMAGAMRFTTAELSELASRIADAAGEALSIELAHFEALCGQVRATATALAMAADALAALDAFAGLAHLAVETGAVRPHLDEGLDFKIVRGRHPTVEAALKRDGAQGFVPNDCDLSPGGAGRLWLVTGPNMAGKSTFLRQQAILTILAQMGAFVPAAEARIGVVDRLFSRVGAADDLARGRSTFMVEMVETATILNLATPRSLVILDEIGRGTATYDGLSIAWAAIEHLHGVNKSRALFATHYHEMTQLAGTLPGVVCVTAQVKEWKGGIVFLHSIAPGAAERSYGIQVAKLAGLPASVVARAQAILASLEKSGRAGKKLSLADDMPLFAELLSAPPPPAPPAEPSAVELELRALDVDSLTPRQALEALYRLKSLGY